MSGTQNLFADQSTQFLPPSSFSDLAEKAGPAVVNIQTEKTVQGGGQVFRHFFGPEFESRQPDLRKQQSLGSGFIIDKAGYIVTNNHVIANSDSIKVILQNEKSYEAKIIGRDSKTDLALIKIEAENDLPALELGNSDQLRVGQWVVAIGNPFGLDHTVTAGIVSAKGRVIGSGPYDDYIQTDASINPGNSGGPLLNLDGQVIGINAAIINGGQGIGFAIPASTASRIVAQLKDSGEVSRGWLGVRIQDINPELSAYYGVKGDFGVIITDVFENNPADRAGIKVNDVIIELNGDQVKTSQDLIRKIAVIKPGDSISLKVVRSSKVKTFTVEIIKRNDTEVASNGNSFGDFGLKVTELSVEAARQLGLPSPNGAVIAQVEPGGKAQKAGISSGDILLEINHRKVINVDEFSKIVNSIKTGEKAAFVLFRPNQGLRIANMIR
ncbi:MAG: Do family serine endopeptidase [SAR324 cluster bacterium]|nr:Do family serine endopeptidase [SAR324 cluster bacterium]